MRILGRLWRIYAICFFACLASGAVPEIAQAAEAPVIEKLLTTDVEVTADGLSTQIVHEELQATNAASAMRLGQQAIPYIESIQDLEITEAYTLKSDGRKIPVNPQAIYVQQPRTGTDLQTIDDVRQKVIVFPDVAAGDVVSLTMKLRSKQTLLPGQFFFSAFFAHQQAFQEVRETIVAPKSLPLNVEAHEVEYKKEDTGNTFTYRFHYSAPQSVTDEVAAVSPLDHLPRFYVSSLANYNEFGRAYANVAASKEIVTPKIQALADQLTQGIGSQREQTKKIYEWVSAHIRYVAIELGRGSIVPHEAESVLINGYGDCKDHAILFAALLKAKGIDSQSVLINAGKKSTGLFAAGPGSDPAATGWPASVSGRRAFSTQKARGNVRSQGGKRHRGKRIGRNHLEHHPHLSLRR